MNTTQKEPALLVGNDFISVVIGNKPFTIYKNDVRFPQVLAAVKSRNWEALDKLLDTAKAIGQYTFGNVHIVDGVVSYGNSPLHNAVVTKLLEFMRNDYPFEPLAKFLDKLMQNPSMRSVESAYAFLEKYKMPVCEDGDFLAYKAVDKDMKDYHTHSIDNSLGKIIEVPRNQVSDDPNHACHFGLHVASCDFAKDFAHTDGILIIVKINPKDIVSVPNDADAKKMRVCRYEVVEVIGTKDKVQDFSSDYVANDDNQEDETLDQTGINNDDTHDYTFDEQVTNESLNPNITVGPKPKQTIGSNKAYELYKQGKEVYYHGILINNEHSRQFFRDRKGFETNDDSNIVKTPIVKVAPKVMIGANKAYRLNRDGITVYSSVGVPINDKCSRNFFRSRSGWTVDEKYANY